MTPDDVTADWLSNVLGGPVDAFTTQRIGDGHIGMNLRVGLTSSDPSVPESVVLKMPSPDPTSQATAAMLRHYEREVKFYLEIADTVDIGVPHCHHGEWTPDTNDFVLVLEDMSPAVAGDQVAGCTLDDARAAVLQLAALHGPRWDDPTLSDVGWLSRHEGQISVDQLKMMWQMFFPGFATTYRSQLTDEMFGLAEAFAEHIGTWAGERSGPMAVTHGDYRLDNMLFGPPVEAGSPLPRITVVDWQTPGHGPPIVDLSYFVGAGLLPDARREHEQSLVALYAEGLATYGVDVDDDWLWEQYRRETFSGLMVAVVASQIVALNERSEAMFGAMASRHLQHALDLDTLDLL